NASRSFGAEVDEDTSGIAEAYTESWAERSDCSRAHDLQESDSRTSTPSIRSTTAKRFAMNGVVARAANGSFRRRSIPRPSDTEMKL
ncbi:MAG TPA: hypothetical protein VFU23_02040, partial [Gemmatimonadales bacterium]|nr:hypothetical protein [Gemmatimonadales bacterium]